VQRLHILRDNHNVCNDVTVLGRPRRVQVTLTFHIEPSCRDLHPRWDVSEHDLADYADEDDVIDLLALSAEAAALLQRRYHSGGEEFQSFRHVWRSFCWNEDAGLSEFAQLGGQPLVPDLGGLWGLGEGVSGRHARVPRPVGPTLEYQDDSRECFRPARVVLSAGSAAVDITESVEIWPDRAGLTITRDLFTVSGREIVSAWRPFADSTDDGVSDDLRQMSYLTLLHNTLRGEGVGMTIALSGSIDDDRCVRGHAVRRPRSSWPLVARKVVRLATYQQQRTTDTPPGEADIVDETAAAEAHAAALRDAGEDELGHASIVLPMLSRSYAPGTGIDATAGREVELTVDGGDRRDCAVVRSVRFRFGAIHTTELVLDSPLLGLAR